MPWSTPFEGPIELQNGLKLNTLRDAAIYIQKLPNAEKQAQQWPLATQALIMGAQGLGPLRFARAGVKRALNRQVKRVFNPDPKDTRRGKPKPKRKLTRDQ